MQRTEIECCRCGVLINITVSFKQHLLDTKQSFYCINGHCQSYTESTTEKLKKQILEKDSKITILERQITSLKDKPKRGRPSKK